MILGLTIVVCSGLYFLLGGLAYGLVDSIGKDRCRRSYHDDDCGHWWLAGMSVPLWPLTAVIVIIIVLASVGINLGRRFSGTVMDLISQKR